MRRVLGPLLLVVVSFATALLGLEFAGRAAGLWQPDRSFRFHPVRGYELAPGIGEINSLGLRGPEISATKADGVVRVVVIGDSYTFGLGVDETESLPARLEARLNRDGTKRVEVLNLGTPGYNSDQELMYLREKG